MFRSDLPPANLSTKKTRQKTTTKQKKICQWQIATEITTITTDLPMANRYRKNITTTKTQSNDPF
jgi:hypothetical protein